MLLKASVLIVDLLIVLTRHLNSQDALRLLSNVDQLVTMQGLLLRGLIVCKSGLLLNVAHLVDSRQILLQLIQNPHQLLNLLRWLLLGLLLLNKLALGVLLLP
jgi:hypothetical protein